MSNRQNSKQLYVGLMSGTSLDGVDAALVAFPPSGLEPPLLIASLKKNFPEKIREDILDLCQPGSNEINRMAELDRKLGDLFADTIIEMLETSGHCRADIMAIGSHGQTVRHHSADSRCLFSLQIGDPNTIAIRTGITTVADFRRMDIAAQGQGAPLVPAFHDAVLRNPAENRVIANIGGMANITLLARDTPVTGFDTGPGNVLMDAWIQLHKHAQWDQDGAWAAQGEINASLLRELLSHPFFAIPPPKSTGRETFNLDWIASLLDINNIDNAADIQRTLLELTAITLTDCIRKLPMPIDRVLLCGGGSHNHLLRQRITELLPKSQVDDTQAEGIDPDWMEAIAFAWLAKQRIEKKPGNLPAVTGANILCILGGIYEPPESIDIFTRKASQHR